MRNTALMQPFGLAMFTERAGETFIHSPDAGPPIRGHPGAQLRQQRASIKHQCDRVFRWELIGVLHHFDTRATPYGCYTFCSLLLVQKISVSTAVCTKFCRIVAS